MRLRLPVLLLLLILFGASPDLAEAGQTPLPGQEILLEETGPEDLAAAEGLGLDAWLGPDGVRAFLHGQRDIEALSSSGFSWQKVELRTARAADSSPPVLPSGRNSYRYWEDYPSELAELARQYPEYVRWFRIGHSHEGRPILGVEIARDVWREDGRPAFVSYGLVHAREWPSSEMTMEYALQLIRDRDTPRISNILDRVRTFVIPVINPDGLVASRGAQPDSPSGMKSGMNSMRRKNCRPDPGVAPGMPCAAYKNDYGGVDLNRNFTPYWGGAGGSTWKEEPIYRGPSPLSEPESRALSRFLSGLQPQVVISLHTHWPEGLWLRPPAFVDERLFPNNETPDNPALAALSGQMSRATGWLSRKVTFLYPAIGSSTDWSYFNMGSLALTAEIRGEGFHERYGTMVRGEYPGLLEATLLGAEKAATSQTRISGTAPAGARLTISKRMRVPLCSGDSYFRDCKRPFRFREEKLLSSITVPADGNYSWSVLPSARPMHPGERWTLTCRAGGEEIQEVSIQSGEVLELDWEACGSGEAPALSIEDGIESRAGERHVLVARNATGLVEWDLDGDGQFDDGSGKAIGHVFEVPGPHSVAARDSLGQSEHVARINLPYPQTPSVRAQSWSRFFYQFRGFRLFDLTFRAKGPYGSSFSWDIDRDGAFDDGRGAVISRTTWAKKRGRKIHIRVRATLPNGSSATQTVTRRLPPARR